jgi:hypothetical protein
VREYVGHAAFLDSAEPEPVDGAPTPTAPRIIPTGLGDEPLTVEILSAA